jgi:hypothetical protein
MRQETCPLPRTPELKISCLALGLSATLGNRVVLKLSAAHILH